jgi:hypothetical protein
MTDDKDGEFWDASCAAEPPSRDYQDRLDLAADLGVAAAEGALSF